MSGVESGKFWLESENYGAESTDTCESENSAMCC